MVLETDPGDEGGAEGEVEEAFVGYCENDEDGREGKEHDDETVEVVIIRLEAVQEGNGEGRDFSSVSVLVNLDLAMDDLLKTSHPTTWLPNGRPRFACNETLLDRVTTMASTIKPV